MEPSKAGKENQARRAKIHPVDGWMEDGWMDVVDNSTQFFKFKFKLNFILFLGV
jgi:hypothetical protein